MDRYVPYVAPFYSNCFPTTITNPITHTFSYIRAIFSFNILPKTTLASGLKESGIDPLYHLSQSCQNTTKAIFFLVKKKCQRPPSVSLRDADKVKSRWHVHMWFVLLSMEEEV